MLTNFANQILNEPNIAAFAQEQPLALVSLKVVLVCDMVESVKFMTLHEDYAVACWQAFVVGVRQKLVPALHSQVVKSMGDGLMILCPDPRSAIELSKNLHSFADHLNQNQPTDQHLKLRIGIHQTRVRSDEHDIYGQGVNLAARIASLGKARETVVSAVLREQLIDGLDGQFEDMGECFLKHIEEPQRVYRMRSDDPENTTQDFAQYPESVKAVVAVIPFVARSNTIEQFAIGELIAEGVISQLCFCNELKIISRLSTTALRDQQSDFGALKRLLGAQFAVGGSYVLTMDRLLVNITLSNVDNQAVVWADRVSVPVQDLLEENSELIHRVSKGIINTLQSRFADMSYKSPLPTLPSYSLMLGGIQLAHRNTKNDFYRAHEVFEHLLDRHQRFPVVSSWLAKWHVLQAAQGWSDDPSLTAKKALALSTKALDLDPNSSLALAVDGFVRADMHRDFEGAMQRYNLAIGSNPNELFAWLFKGLLHGYKGETESALASVEASLSLSPIDPAIYFIYSLAASTYLSAQKYDKAIEFGTKSIKANFNHVSSFRVLTIASVLNGNLELGRQYAARVMELDPSFSVRKFEARRSGGHFNEMSQMFASALSRAGIPT